MSTRPSVFLAEDEPLILMHLRELMQDLGFEVAGSAATVESALQQVRDLSFDIAVLDIKLRGESIGPVADVLAGRGLPFIFATGYNSFEPVVAAHATRPRIGKPYRVDELRTALFQALAAAQPSAG
jgi:CheY-like chemotaxis protein